MRARRGLCALEQHEASSPLSLGKVGAVSVELDGRDDVTCSDAEFFLFGLVKKRKHENHRTFRGVGRERERRDADLD
jgi:hypothetical protein